MVGNALQTKGGFAHLANSKPAGKPAQSDRKLKARKRAAGPSRTTGAAKAPSSEINPLSLSDAEFEKMVGSRA
jgi:hypothetical protein